MVDPRTAGQGAARHRPLNLITGGRGRGGREQRAPAGSTSRQARHLDAELRGALLTGATDQMPARLSNMEPSPPPRSRGSPPRAFQPRGPRPQRPEVDAPDALARTTSRATHRAMLGRDRDAGEQQGGDLDGRPTRAMPVDEHRHVSIAPTNAAAETTRPLATTRRPGRSPRIAPSAAPLDTPMTAGSASGFRNNP